MNWCPKGVPALQVDASPTTPQHHNHGIFNAVVAVPLIAEQNSFQKFIIVTPVVSGIWNRSGAAFLLLCSWLICNRKEVWRTAVGGPRQGHQTQMGRTAVGGPR